MSTLNTTLNAPTRSGARGFFIAVPAQFLNSTGSAVMTAVVGAGATQETVSGVPESSTSQWLNVKVGSLLYDHGAGEAVTLTGT